MPCIAVGNNCILAAKRLLIDAYIINKHSIIDVQERCNIPGNDSISDLVISPDMTHAAMITATTKKLMVFNLPEFENYNCVELPRSASKIRFTRDGNSILVADKSGDAIIYNIKSDVEGKKILGHLSLLLDILQTNDEKFIITSDRDEKIRVSCYPNCYNIQTYCLGHQEFVNHIEILSHNDKYLTSSSGDSTVRVWDYISGALCYTIETYSDVSNPHNIEQFVKSMNDEGVEVKTLPIVNYSITKLSTNSTFLAVTIYSLNEIFCYSLTTQNDGFYHKLEHRIQLSSFPTAIMCYNSKLYIYFEIHSTVSVYNIIQENNKANIVLDKNIEMFKEKCDFKIDNNASCPIKMLYKRKFDNVQEYLNRKKQRLEQIK